jgi:uncharacterized protein YcbK (DUF882 family)
MDHKRRQLCLFGGVTALSALLFPTSVFAKSNKLASHRRLWIRNLHTNEEIKSTYFNGNKYLTSELKKLNHLCRDFRQNEVKSIDKELFNAIVQIQKVLGHTGRVNLISGYRSPKTNKMLRKGSGVAKKSYHMQGKAIDFNLEGVSLARVRRAALNLKMGGVGYYPRSNFVHIDMGPVRSWGG